MPLARVPDKPSDTQGSDRGDIQGTPVNTHRSSVFGHITSVTQEQREAVRGSP